eukprot:2500829-Prymnesium_polylepis.1
MARPARHAPMVHVARGRCATPDARAPSNGCPRCFSSPNARSFQPLVPHTSNVFTHLLAPSQVVELHSLLT